MNLVLKFILPTLSFYAIAVAAVFGLENLSPSGPCTPGAGIVLFFLLIPFCILLFAVNLYKTFKNHKKFIARTIVHGIAIAVLFIFNLVIKNLIQ